MSHHSGIIFTILTLLAGLLPGYVETVVAQSIPYYSVHGIQSQDIYTKTLGPQTSEVVLSGYRDRTEYHEIRYVSVLTGSDVTGDGSINRPWASIGHALDQINNARLSRRYALLIGNGNYTEGELLLKEYIHLYGGFDPATWNRDLKKNLTTIDGKNQNRLFIAADHAKIDGFLLINGEARGFGGAILCNGTSPIISNNIFRSNKTLAPDPWNPEFIHEIANDGGAIAAINGGAPLILSNLFFENTTQIGRGGAIGAHNRGAPRIQYNVFVDNATGTHDPMRSSDGGAISSSFYSNADIFYNVVLNNKSLARNDGGGIFSEMWSSLHIAGNIILGNYSDDDGGGLYLSGSVHHYITEHEPGLPPERYYNYLSGNVIAGNYTRGAGVSGGFRFTYFTRLLYMNNISFDNSGGIDFRRTEVIARGNLVFENATFRDQTTAKLFNNKVFGILDIESNPELENHYTAGIENPDVLQLYKSGYRQDSYRVDVLTHKYDTLTHSTMLTVSKGSWSDDPNIVNRIVRAGDQWSVIKEADSSSITVWGRVEDISTMIIYPTFTRD